MPAPVAIDVEQLRWPTVNEPDHAAIVAEGGDAKTILRALSSTTSNEPNPVPANELDICTELTGLGILDHSGGKSMICRPMSMFICQFIAFLLSSSSSYISRIKHDRCIPL